MKAHIAALIHSAGVIGLIVLSTLLDWSTHQFSPQTATAIQWGIGALGANGVGHALLAAITVWRQNASGVATTASPSEQQVADVATKMSEAIISQLMAKMKTAMTSKGTF